MGATGRCVSDQPLTLKVMQRLDDLAPAVWNACAGRENPTLCYEFLHALEETGCATARAGWQPQHLVAEDGDGSVLGVVPLYLKGHSYGEYVFDWAWADAYERAGGRYYPKLQCAVPFTPVTGQRLLLNPAAGHASSLIADTLVAGLIEVARRHEASSLHVTFPTEAEWQRMGAAGFLQRIGLQYHFSNPGYGSFDDFLGSLASRKRKAIRKERARVAESGLTVRALAGEQIEPRHWDAFYRFYMATADRKWGSPYLTRAFFHRIGATMGDRIVLIVAEDRGQPVAGALNLRGADALYGRNWGCLGDYRFLHFEACYYQAIDFAIAHGLRRVEAGAQGEHKIQRGYLPVETYSAHWIPDESFREAVERFLLQERGHIRAEIDALGDYSPFRTQG